MTTRYEMIGALTCQIEDEHYKWQCAGEITPPSGPARLGEWLAWLIMNGGIDLPGGARLMIVEPATDDEQFWTHEDGDSHAWFQPDDMPVPDRYVPLFRQWQPEWEDR